MNQHDVFFSFFILKIVFYVLVVVFALEIETKIKKILVQLASGTGEDGTGGHERVEPSQAEPSREEGFFAFIISMACQLSSLRSSRFE